MLRIARIGVVAGLMVGVAAVSQAGDNPCAEFLKGTTQTPAGMCIDGVLFKDVLARLAALESRVASPTTPQGKLAH